MRISLFVCVVIAILSVLAGCQGLPARTTSTFEDVGELFALFVEQEYDPDVIFLVETANEKAPRAWQAGSDRISITEVMPEEVQEKWREARDRMEEFKECRFTTGLGTMVIADISAPAQAIATVCHNWIYEFHCEDLHLTKDRGQWKVVASQILEWVHCDPPEPP